MADLETIEEKLDFLIFMQSKTIQQASALAGQPPRMAILPGDVLFKQWQESKRKAAEKERKLKEEGKPLPDENSNQNSHG